MSVFNSLPPKINKKRLITWLMNTYDFLNNKQLSLQKLNSERDKNFLLSVNKKSCFVIKISNTLESKKLLELQDYVLTSLNKRSAIRKFIPKKKHRSIKTYLDDAKRPCNVRILSYIQGKIYAKYKNTDKLESSLGSLIGILSKELQNLSHESSLRKFEWDPSSVDWIENYLNLFSSRQKKNH